MVNSHSVDHFEPGSARMAATAGASQLVQVDVVTDPALALGLLESLHGSALGARHQSPHFVGGWLQAGADPAFVRIATSHGPVILPLEMLPGGVAVYVGARHANGNFPVGSPEALQALGAAGIEAIRSAPALRRAGLKMLALERQYDVLDSIANPFVAARSIESAVSFSLRVDCGMDAILERTHSSKRLKKIRKQARQLETVGPVSLVIPDNPAVASRMLAMLFAWKGERLKSMGIHDVFADDRTRSAFDFMFTAFQGDDIPAQRIMALKAGDETLALLGATVHRKRIAIEFSTFNPDHARLGPGDALFQHAIAWAAENGFEVFDFCVGDEAFKRLWCDTETRHFDTYIPLNPIGRIAALGRQTSHAAIQKIKDNRELYTLLKTARRKLKSHLLQRGD